jgi:hypothetical protein
MDPHNTPGYRLHRSLTNLKRTETTGFDDVEQERIETARTLLQKVSLLSQSEPLEEADSRAEF